jgi:hypothetical protein
VQHCVLNRTVIGHSRFLTLVCSPTTLVITDVYVRLRPVMDGAAPWRTQSTCCRRDAFEPAARIWIQQGVDAAAGQEDVPYTTMPQRGWCSTCSMATTLLGSGKTHLMNGGAAPWRGTDCGIVPRCLDALLTGVAAHSDATVAVSF